jgi:succinoglycan biosynthesis transport protein ExoP
VDPLSSNIGSVDLAEYVRRLHSWSWLVLLGVVAGVVGSLMWTGNQDELYRAEASVLVLPVDAGTSATLANSRTDGAVNLDTEAQVVRSALISEAVHEALTEAGGVAVPAVPELMEQLEVTVPPNSQVLRVGYVAGTAADAQTMANAFAHTYLNERSQTVTAALDNARTRLTEQREALQNELNEIIGEIGELNEELVEPPELALAESRRDILVGQINAVDTELAELESVRVEPGRLLTAAPLPAEPFAPQPVIDVAAGILLGLVVGAGLALLADRFDHKIRRSGDVEKARFPVIGTIPGQRRRLTTLDAGHDDGVDDAADRIRNRLVSYAPNATVIQVAPASPNHGCGLAGAALAASFGRERGQALLIVTDPDSPVAQRLAGDPPGLSDRLIAGGRSGDDATGAIPGETVLVLPDELPRVAIMGPGSDPSQLTRVLQPTSMTRLLKQIANDYPIVIIETPNIASAGAQAVARAADMVVLVAMHGVTDDRTLAASGENLSGLHARLGGVVLAPRLDPPAEDGQPLGVGLTAGKARPNPERPNGPNAGRSRGGPAHSGKARSSHRRVTEGPASHEPVPAGSARRS